MMSIIKASLKDSPDYIKFVNACNGAKSLTEKKRVYMGDYGFENVKEYFNLETDELKKKENYDRYSFDGVVEWWKNKASKRYESLKADGRLRTELEVWNIKNDIDIIR